MLKNIYTPLAGAIAQERVLDIIANNLANANTVGFKEEAVSFKLIEPEPERTYVEPLPPANFKIDLSKWLPFRGNEMSYVGVSGVYRDYHQGSPLETKNPLDLMIEGDGFLAVNTKEGVRYSRNGSLAIAKGGVLSDQNGMPVLGAKGIVSLNGSQIQINTKGEIYQDGEFVDQLQIIDFDNKEQLEKVGLNLYHYTGPTNGAKGASPTIRQGFLESSNVNTIKNLTSMIIAHRSYEAYQQAIKNYDNMMDKSNNRIGELQA